MNVAVIPSTANRIRALAAAKPKLGLRELAKELGVHHHLVELSLGKGDKRRPKSRVADASLRSGQSDGRHTR